MDNKKLLRQIGVKPNKDLGQNFLIEPYVAESIVRFANPSKEENIIEIGPGLGALTSELAAIAAITVIEIEEKFCKHLKQEFPEIKIINEDVRYVDFSELGNDLVIFGNLPYSFSSDISYQLLAFSDCIKRAVIMLQKEFAARLAAKPNTKAYGSLSIFTQIKAEALLGPEFPGDCFYPEAKVDSQVIELRFYKESPYKIKDDLLFKQLVLTLFSQRRKKISNTIKKVPEIKNIDFKELFLEANIDPDCRPENLSIQDYVQLSNLIIVLTKI